MADIKVGDVVLVLPPTLSILKRYDKSVKWVDEMDTTINNTYTVVKILNYTNYKGQTFLVYRVNSGITYLPESLILVEHKKIIDLVQI